MSNEQSSYRWESSLLGTEQERFSGVNVEGLKYFFSSILEFPMWLIYDTKGVIISIMMHNVNVEIHDITNFFLNQFTKLKKA